MIPALIHLIWVQGIELLARDYPDGLRAVQAWKHFHPGYEVRLWGELEYLPVVARQFPRLLPFCTSDIPNAFKADIARMAILREFGGIYCDMDNMPIENVEHLISDATFAITSLNVTPGERIFLGVRDSLLLANHFIASTPQHEIWDNIEAKTLLSRWDGPTLPTATRKIIGSPFLELLYETIPTSGVRFLSQDQTYPEFKAPRMSRRIKVALNSPTLLSASAAVKRVAPVASIVHLPSVKQRWRTDISLRHVYEWCCDNWLLAILILGLTTVVASTVASRRCKSKCVRS